MGNLPVQPFQAFCGAVCVVEAATDEYRHGKAGQSGVSVMPFPGLQLTAFTYFSSFFGCADLKF